MSDYQFNMGPLRSAITIQFHTHNATRLWTGRRKTSDGVAEIIGMPRFIDIMNQIKQASSHDDPYADLWMIRMEEKLTDSRGKMQEMIKQADVFFKTLPEDVLIENCLNIQPARFALYIRSQLGYLCVYLLTDFDQLARQLHLAHHIAIISRKEMHIWLNSAGGLIRSVYGLAQRYRHSGITRQDIRLNTARSIEAKAKFGEIPDDILTGARRSTYATNLKTPKSATDTESTDESWPGLPEDDNEDNENEK
jgi:integrating conjugative element protein (TIGR03761 family)